jgi:hypothetical protein
MSYRYHKEVLEGPGRSGVSKIRGKSREGGGMHAEFNSGDADINLTVCRVCADVLGIRALRSYSTSI